MLQECDKLSDWEEEYPGSRHGTNLVTVGDSPLTPAENELNYLKKEGLLLLHDTREYVDDFLDNLDPLRSATNLGFVLPEVSLMTHSPFGLV